MATSKACLTPQLSPRCLLSLLELQSKLEGWGSMGDARVPRLPWRSGHHFNKSPRPRDSTSSGRAFTLHAANRG